MPAGLVCKGNDRPAERNQSQTRRAELGKALEDGADGVGDGLVGMKQDFPIPFSPNHAHGQAAA
jgi:hypothetical protein